MKLLKTWLVKPDQNQNIMQILRISHISTEDSWIPIGDNFNYYYYYMHKIIEKPFVYGKFPEELISAYFYLGEEGNFYSR